MRPALVGIITRSPVIMGMKAPTCAASPSPSLPSRLATESCPSTAGPVAIWVGAKSEKSRPCMRGTSAVRPRIHSPLPTGSRRASSVIAVVS